MDSETEIPDSIKTVKLETILQCFTNTYTRKSNLKVYDPKSIFGNVSKQLTKRNDSTLLERKYLHALWHKSIKVVITIYIIVIIFNELVVRIVIIMRS